MQRLAMTVIGTALLAIGLVTATANAGPKKVQGAKAGTPAAAPPADDGKGPHADVGGVRLGMTLEQAKSALAKHKPKLSLHERPYMGGGASADNSRRIEVLEGETPNQYDSGPFPSYRMVVTLGAFLSPPRVVRIARLIKYDQKTVPSLQNTASALAEKFGCTAEPPGVGATGPMITAYCPYDRAGVPSQDAQTKRECQYLAGNSRELPEACSFTLSASLVPQAGSPTEFSLELVDQPGIVAARKAEADAVAAAQKAAQDARDKQAAQNKPEL